MSTEEDREEEREEPEITVKDRRRLTEEEREGKAPPPSQEPSQEPHSETAGPQTTAASEEEREDREETPHDINVQTLVSFFVAELAARAWIHMGIQQNPVTGLVVKDLPQARMAIDCTAALVEQISPTLDEPGRRELQSLLSTLRINFVQQSGA